MAGPLPEERDVAGKSSALPLEALATYIYLASGKEMGLKREETLGRRKNHLSFEPVNQGPGEDWSSFGETIAWGPLFVRLFDRKLA